MKQISDLFAEGAEAYLGDDNAGKPVVIWVNKLNSFEREEAQRDGIVRRAERLAQLGPDSPETQSIKIEMQFWDDERLRNELVEGESDEIYLEALNNLSIDASFRELEEYVRRAPALQADEDLAPDDPRLATLEEKVGEYSARLDKERRRIRDERLADLETHERPKLEERFLDAWRRERGFGDYSEAKRTTELYLALRACVATFEKTLADERIWDHSACDHSVKFLTDRKNIRRIPDRAMVKIVEVYNSLQTDPRDAGNSGAPASSSVSSGPSSTPEAPSTPSSPAETSPAAPGI
jgi:hypothetical protein